jgi:hypothetical protein
MLKLLPHLPQNTKSHGFKKLHLGQMISNLAPHLPQKVSPSGFSKWHFAHFIRWSLYLKIQHTWLEKNHRHP